MSCETTSLSRFNTLSASACYQTLLSCCGSSRWAKLMEAARPFQSWLDLQSQAKAQWSQLTEGDWLEAFSHHPAIGASRHELESQQGLSAASSLQEQKGMLGAGQGVLAEFKQLNQRYYDQFGFVFLICASGKGAEEMLSALKLRLHNERSEEIALAAAEQAKITALRLQKLAQEL